MAIASFEQWSGGIPPTVESVIQTRSKPGPKPRFPPGVRICTECGWTKEVAQFTPIALSKSGYYSRCRACRARLAWERNHPGRRYEERLRRQADRHSEQSWRDRYRAYGLARIAAWSNWLLSSLASTGAPQAAGMGGVVCVEPGVLESATGPILTSVSGNRRACDAIDSVGRLQPPRRYRHRCQWASARPP
jgi:hypothetical protein